MTRVSDLLKQGLACDKAGRHDEAARAYRRALELEPDNVDAMHLLGLSLFDLGDVSGARRYVEMAVKARPYNAIFCHNYASITLALGQMDVAEPFFRRAIELKPDYAEAYYGLAGMLKASHEDRLLYDIEAVLAGEQRTQRDRAFLHFAAGKLADDIDEPDRAFFHYARGNRAASRPFDREAHRAAAADQLRIFTSDLFDGFRGVGSDSDAMIFVVGMPRSGTTLIEQMLGEHPRVHAAGERQDISILSGILPQLDPQRRRFPDCVPHIPAHVFGAFAERYLAILREKDGAAVRFVDKNPLNFSYLGLIALMFPNARIVHCRRDPADTGLSCYFQYFQHNLDFTFDLGDIASVYRDYRCLMDSWSERLPIPMLHVDYENVVADYEGQSRRIVEFCGLSWDAACPSRRKEPSPVWTASKWQVRQPIYRTSVARARKYQAHLGPLLEGLAPYL